MILSINSITSDLNIVRQASHLWVRIDASISWFQTQLQNNVQKHFAKMRVLCLHGMGTNSGIFEAQSRKVKWGVEALPFDIVSGH